MPDFPVGIRNGLISGEHRRRMGMAIWEFMWLVDHVTEEYQTADGEIRGRVLGGTVVKADRIAEEMGISENTAQDSLKKLRLAGYIDYRKAAYGYRIEVRNSKKWTRAPTGATDYGDERNGEQENRRTGETSDSPGLHDSRSPAPLDIAVRDDISEVNVHDQEDAAAIWAGVVGVVERQSTPRAAEAARACRPSAVDSKEITVILPREPEAREALSRNAAVIRQAVRDVSGRSLFVKFLDPPVG
ncbi:MAG TPA: hypothetical protein VD969_19745 [Symbiobacteriaceae bacterium]|nr:hypothetical protein [Symbiobacteriaceae bacterium]